MRRILFQETDFNALPNPPAGFKYIGFDGPNFSEKGEDGQISQSGGPTGAPGPQGPAGTPGAQGPAGPAGGGGNGDRLVSGDTSTILSNIASSGYLQLTGMTYYETSFSEIDGGNTYKVKVDGNEVAQAQLQLYLDGINNSFANIYAQDAAGRKSDIQISASNDYGEQSVAFNFYDGFSETKTFKFDKLGFLEFPDGTTQSTAFDGSSSGSSYQEVTYSELSGLIDTTSLNPGSYYLITDFKTCYDQPDYDFNGDAITGSNWRESDVHPILVLATSDSTLAPDAYQPDYPSDKIKYDITFTQTEVTGGTAFGRITERIDEFNNRTDYDHRNIRFKRYLTRTLFETLSGRILSMTDGLVIGTGSNFTGDFSTGSAVFIESEEPRVYKVTSIASNTEMTVDGTSFFNFDDSIGFQYYHAFKKPTSGIPYTHTQMADIDNEASLEDYESDGSVQNSDLYFGDGSNYFTNMYPGLFVLAAYDINIDTFSINGEIGADGSGSVEVNVFTYSQYTIFTKSVYDTGDPSINHIIIVDSTDESLERTFDVSTEFDDHVIKNLSSATQIHYLLFALQNGVKADAEQLQNVYQDYLSLIDVSNINTTLSSLNSDYTTITDNLPANSNDPGSLYYFYDFGENYIIDGGNDMYDDGNFIMTNLFGTYVSLDMKQTNIEEDNLIYREILTFDDVNFGEISDPVEARNNYIGNACDDWQSSRPFMLPNNVFTNYTDGNLRVYDNYFGDRFVNNTFGGDVYENYIGGDARKNTFYNDFYDNLIGANFNTNSFYQAPFSKNDIGVDFNNNIMVTNNSEQFQDNNIGNGFSNNWLFNNTLFRSNQIGDDFHDNKFFADFYDNAIGNDFYQNQIYREVYDNTIRNDFNNNYIYNSFIDNNIDNQFETNTIGVSTNIGAYEFIKNKIRVDVKGNLFVGNVRYNTFGDNFYSNEISNEFNGNVFGLECIDNVFGNNFEVNQIETYFSLNTILNDCKHNKIGNNFYNNEIANNFAFNEIGHYFQNNTIGNDFGSGGGSSYGNKIGNYFQNNTIGEYFYSNRITDEFGDNLTGNYFRYNDIQVQNFNSYDFLSGYQNIISFTDNTGLSPSIPGTDNGDPVTYPGLTCTGGSGYDASFDVTVNGSVVTTVTLNNAGYEYQVNDELTIPYLGYGGTSSLEIVITVGSVSATPEVYGNYNCTIFKNSGGNNRLSYYDESDTLIVVTP